MTRRLKAYARRVAGMRHRFLPVLLCMTLMLAACKETLNTKVSESEANEVLSVLLDAGIEARKIPADEKSYDVEVDKDDLARALDVLHAHGLPHAQYEDLGQIFKKDGLVATPAEERVRYIYGVSQELEQTLAHIDGVVVARVHVVIPQNDPLADSKTPSSASVFIKYRPSADPNALAPLVRNLVVRGIEGLDPDHVSVAFVVAEPPATTNRVQIEHVLGVRVDTKSVAWLLVLLALPWTLVFIVVVAIATRYRAGVKRECVALAAWGRGVWQALRGKRDTSATGAAAAAEALPASAQPAALGRSQPEGAPS